MLPRGPSSKTAVVAIKDRSSNQIVAEVTRSTAAPALQAFVVDNAPDAEAVYTDGADAYKGLPQPHDSVKHTLQEYVRGPVHTNGVESFWSMLKRAHKGTFHKMSPKHLERYVQEFAGRHNVSENGARRFAASGNCFMTASALASATICRRSHSSSTA